MAVFACMRPHAGNKEPVPRRENISPAKLEAEGAPAENQIVLGWEIETRIFIIRLPFDKYTAWICDLHVLIKSGETTIKALESIIGRLNHAAYVIPLSRHFLNRLRSRLERMGPTHPTQTFRLTMDELKDAELWVTFLAQARVGISLKCLSLHQPSQVAISDSYPFVLGGFTW